MGFLTFGSLGTISGLTMVLRLFLAGFCGGAIGYERENRQKPAGLRTHVIIGVASSLMIIISKYGFYDVLADHINVDPSRVAASVVTAVGFLGSGVIFTRNKTVSGITTSAGIWATVGVGLAIGSGQLFLGVVATGMILIVELFLGRSIRFSPSGPNVTRITAEISGDQAELSALKEKIEAQNFKVRRFEFTQKEGEPIKASLLVTPLKGRNVIDIPALKESWILSLEVKGRLV